MNQENRNFLFDANALIDFQKTEFSVLAKVKQHLGNKCQLKAVRGLTKNDCRLADLTVISLKDHIKKWLPNPMVAFHRQIDLIYKHQLIQDIVW